MNFRKLLWPFSLPYGWITAFRNLSFDKGWLPSQSFETPLIAVGNLSVGGTGKTPMIEFLIEKLDDKNVGLVSRGYGRQTKGLLVASPQNGPAEIGDEPWQMFHKFPHIHLAVAEKRPEGTQALIDQFHPEVILLDDAFQHRYIRPEVQILLTTFQRPFYNDLVLPAGNLRESIIGKKRADLIVVTKCPDTLSEKAAAEMIVKIEPTEDQEVFFAGISYGNFINQKKEHPSRESEVNVLTGIANPSLFVEEVRKNFKVLQHRKFADHHDFSDTELQQISQQAQSHPLLTTEKDYARISTKLSSNTLQNIFYLPIRVRILFDREDEFLEEVQKRAGIH